MALTASQILSLKGWLPKIGFLLGVLFIALLVWVAWSSHVQNPTGIAITPNIGGTPASKVSVFPVIIFLVGVPVVTFCGIASLVTIFMAGVFSGGRNSPQWFSVLSKWALILGRLSLFGLLGLLVGLVVMYVGITLFKL